MSPVPSHEDLEEMLPAAALEILEQEDLELVAAHLVNCRECATLLQEYREVAAALALQLPLRPLDAGRTRALRKRLVARATGSGPGRADGRAQGRSRALRLDRWMGWAVAAGLAGVLLTHHSVHRAVDYGWLAAGILVFLSLGLGIYSWIQRKRVAELESRLGDVEVKGTEDAQGSQDTQGGPRGGYSSVLSQE